MYVCERQIGESVKEMKGVVHERCRKEKEGKMQFQITCACGAAWVGMCWRLGETQRAVLVERD